MIEFDSPYQTHQQVVKLIQASRPTLYRWMKEGNFPKPVHMGPNMVRWKASDINTWLAEKEAV